MKIRIGFVSNSSSSSFILAVRPSISENEKKRIFKKYIKDHYRYALSARKCHNNWGFEKVPSEEETIRDIFEPKFGGHLELDSWSVYWGECGSEGSNFFSYLFYCLLEIDTPEFKFKSYC